MGINGLCDPPAYLEVTVAINNGSGVCEESYLIVRENINAKVIKLN